MFYTLLHEVSFFAADIGEKCNPHIANQASEQKNTFFGFPHWWQYIKTGEFDALGVCSPKVKIPDGLWAIGLAALDMLLYVAGIVAVVSIIIAGISLITATGNAEKATSARRRVVNSLIGLAIVLVAAAVVSFVGNSFAGSGSGP